MKNAQNPQVKFSSLPIPIRVLLVHSHQMVLWGLEKLINSESPNMEIVGKTTDGWDALRLTREQKPHILLLDMNIKREKNQDLIPALLREGEGKLHIIIFTEVRDPNIIDVAVLSGVRGVICKDEPTQNILKAIEKVHSGELWLDRETTGRIFTNCLRTGQKPTNAVAQKIASLTRKERTIVNAFADDAGASNKKIARNLCISEQTLRNHLTSIFDKLDLTNRFDLFMFAKRHRGEIDALNAPSASSSRDS
jgi:two-component system nitrate/nitrite response regulator NarL